MKKWAVLGCAIMGLGCPQVLPDLSTVKGSTAVITSFGPSMGYAAKGEDFAGTLVCIEIDGFAAGLLDVWFGAQLAGKADPKDNEVCVRAPAGLVGRTSIFVQRTVNGAVLQRAGSSQSFLALDVPVINDLSPWEIFGVAAGGETCAADPCAADAPPAYCGELALPDTGECQQRGRGSLLTVRGESLSSESEIEDERTHVTLWASGPSSHTPLGLDRGSFSEDMLELCIPPEAWAASATRWNLSVQTPAGLRELLAVADSPGCPVAENVDPSAAYQNGVATIFGYGFASDVELNSVWLVSEDGLAFAAEVLSSSPSALTIQIPDDAQLIPSGRALTQTHLVVATPTGRSLLETPFAVMGAPEIDQISPRQVFANPPSAGPGATPDPDPWYVTIDGRGFDISSIAANIVELGAHDQDAPMFFPPVVAVSPVQLVLRMPSNIPPGMYDLSVTTTAGPSTDACEAGVLDQQVGNRGCLQVLGSPQIAEIFPARVAWGDSVTLRGGPFDPLGLEQTQVLLRVAGLDAEAEILSSRLDVMQIRLPAQPGGVPVASPLIDPGNAVELRLRYAGTDSEARSLQVVDQRRALGAFVVSSTTLHFPGDWLPSQAWGAPAQAIWTWLNKSRTQIAVYLASLDLIGATAFASPVRSYTTSPGGRFLYAAHMETPAADSLRRYDLNWNLGGSIGYDADNPVDLSSLRASLQMSSQERIVGLASDQGLEIGRDEQLVLVTETGDPPACSQRRVYIAKGITDAAGNVIDPRQSCLLDGFYAQRVDVVRDSQGAEHVLAELNLSKGCTRYAQLPDPGSRDAGFVDSGGIAPIAPEIGTLPWACVRSGSGVVVDTDCLALVELSCPPRPAASAGDDAGVLAPRSIDVDVWVQGLPLPTGSHIVPAALSMTALVASRQPLGASRDQWGRVVDLDHSLRCEEVLTRCDTEPEGSPPSFVSPFFSAELTQVHQAGLIDADTAFALGSVASTSTGATQAQVTIGHRWSPDLSWSSAPFDSDRLSPVAANGAGMMFFSQGQGATDDLKIAVRRPQSIELEQFEIDGCSLSSHLWVVPDSPRVVETGCAELPGATCLVFAGSGYLGQVEANANPACSPPSPSTLESFVSGEFKAWCVGLYDDGALPDLQVLMTSDGVQPRSVEVWDHRVCMIDDTRDLDESVLRCVAVDEACSVGASATSLHLGARLSVPRLTPLMHGRLLISDPLLPELIVVEPQAGGGSELRILARAPADLLPGGISSVLLRRDRDSIVAATAGWLWSVELSEGSAGGAQLDVHRIFADEVLPPVGMTLVQSWSDGQVFLYGAESPDPGARQVMLALDLGSERVLGQAISIDRHSGAILARHGSSRLLLGRRAPAGVSELDLREGALRSWAAMTATPQATSIESLWMSTDGRLLLSTDGVGSLWITF